METVPSPDPERPAAPACEDTGGVPPVRRTPASPPYLRLIAVTLAVLSLALTTTPAREPQYAFVAARKGNVARVRELLAQGVDANLRMRTGWSLLHAAAVAGHGEIARLLLEAGADPNLVTRFPTPLQEAAYYGWPDIAALMLQHGGDPLACDRDNKQAVLVAAQRTNGRVMGLLLAACAGQTWPPELRDECLTASADGSLSVVRAMLDGLPGGASGSDLRRCLSAAVSGQRWPVVGLLLARGAEPSPQMRCGMPGLDPVGQLLAVGKGPDWRPPGGSTALQWAAVTGRLGNLRQLLAAGADIGATDCAGVTALCVAAWHGQLATVRELLAHGALPRASDDELRSALWVAARMGYTPVVRALLRAGVPADMPDESGETALSAAISARQLGTARALLEAGAETGPFVPLDERGSSEPVYRLNKGRSALHYAAAANDPAMAALLLRSGADPTTRDDEGFTPLGLALYRESWAAARYLARACHRHDLCIALGLGGIGKLKALLATHPDLERADEGGLTPLGWAADLGFAEGLRLLLEAGADPNGVMPEAGAFPTSVVPPPVRTPVSLAALHGRADLVRTLIRHGADPDGNPAELGGPLFNAVRWGGGQGHDTARELLSAGAKVDVRFPMAETILHEAVWSPGAVKLIGLLVAYGASVNARDRHKSTPLHTAVAHFPAQEGVVAALLARGADPHLRNDIGRTPLHYAAEVGDVPAVKAFLARHVSLTDRDYMGRTPLWVAARGGSPEVVRLLLDAGSDPGVLDNNHHSALREAEARGQREAARLLRKAAQEALRASAKRR